MIADLKPYSEYKESGLPWLGQVPGHWVIKRGKSYLVAIDVRSKTGREELLTVSSARGVVPRSTANVTMFKAESYAGHKLCWPGDLVINSLWAWAGGLGVSQHHGIISTAYSVYRSRPSAKINSRFLNELVRSSAFHWELQVRSKGVWISRLQLTDTAFLDAPIPLPPPEEQAAIVRFLDWANGRLERTIRAKRKVIALLNEQKQAIIHRAVTRGLDPNVPFKPSGILWLGDIPAHWKVIPLKRLARIIDGDRGPEYPNAADFVATGIPFLSSKSIVNGRLVFNNVPFLSMEKFQRLRQGKLIPGDLVITVRGTIGSCAAFSGEFYPTAFINAQMMILRPDGAKLLSDYLLAISHSKYWINLLALSAYGSAQQQLSNKLLAVIALPLPPEEEQKAILSELAVRTMPITDAISRLEREIELLREYRTRLVADVVTGKLDVRAAAALLPEEVTPEPMDDDVELDDALEDTAEEAAI